MSHLGADRCRGDNVNMAPIGGCSMRSAFLSSHMPVLQRTPHTECREKHTVVVQTDETTRRKRGNILLDGMPRREREKQSFFYVVVPCVETENPKL